jgi:hypothetical protein
VKAIRIVVGPEQGDVPLVFTAVELHPEWVVLHCISTTPQDELAMGLVDGKPARFELTDDLGTEYVNEGGSGGGEGDVRRMDLKFFPSAPIKAKYLRVTTGLGTVIFTL